MLDMPKARVAEIHYWAIMLTDGEPLREIESSQRFATPEEANGKLDQLVRGQYVTRLDETERVEAA